MLPSCCGKSILSIEKLGVDEVSPPRLSILIGVDWDIVCNTNTKSNTNKIINNLDINLSNKYNNF